MTGAEVVRCDIGTAGDLLKRPLDMTRCAMAVVVGMAILSAGIVTVES